MIDDEPAEPSQPGLGAVRPPPSDPPRARGTLLTLVAVLLLLGGVWAISASGLVGPATPAVATTVVGAGLPSDPFRQALGGASQILPAPPSDLGTILLRLVLAALLGLAISFRGSRQRNEFQVVHTNVIIAFTGAMMMIIVGSDLARAFGLVGASSIVRYRTPVHDPRALASLFVSMGAGIAVGVGLYELAIVAAIMVILIEFALERGGPFFTRGRYRPERSYELTLETDQPVQTLKAVSDLFAASNATHVLMNYDQGRKQNVEMGLLVGVPMGADLEQLTLQLLDRGARSVSWRLARDS
jgi:uncharacterized membrane protein YhiD involved in acid resistance